MRQPQQKVTTYAPFLQIQERYEVLLGVLHLSVDSMLCESCGNDFMDVFYSCIVVGTVHPTFQFLSDYDSTNLCFFGNASYDEDEVHTIELAEEKKEITENHNKQAVFKCT